MKIASILLLFAFAVAIISGCAGPASSVCPEMGVVTGIDSPASPLSINSLVGSKAPDFYWDVVNCSNLETTSSSLKMSNFNGKPVMIIFHKSMNCPGCKQQLPFIKAAYETWKDRGLNIITIYRGDQPKDVKGYVQSHNIDFLALADPNDRVASTLGFSIGAPMTVFVDKSGIIQKYQIGPLKSTEDINAVLKTLE